METLNQDEECDDIYIPVHTVCYVARTKYIRDTGDLSVQSIWYTSQVSTLDDDVLPSHADRRQSTKRNIYNNIQNVHLTMTNNVCNNIMTNGRTG